ncbi:hypothetical protein ACJX0J_031032 [Zea mays]
MHPFLVGPTTDDGSWSNQWKDTDFLLHIQFFKKYNVYGALFILAFFMFTRHVHPHFCEPHVLFDAEHFLMFFRTISDFLYIMTTTRSGAFLEHFLCFLFHESCNLWIAA